MVRNDIEQAVREWLHSTYDEAFAITISFIVERPSSMEHGDYSTNLALPLARALEKNPREVAEIIKDGLEGKIKGVEKIDVAGAGFINFYLSAETLAAVVQDAAGDNWGEGNVYAGKKVMVEYTDPNPFKEFHIGHLMSNAIGESIARLFASQGAQVSRANYQGDVGVHVAKALWAKQQKPEMTWGQAYVYGAAEYEAHKEEIDQLNKTIYEKSDAAVNHMYDEGRAESLDHFENIYATLGTIFDYYFFESETGPLGLELVKKHPEVFEESEGAIIFRGEQVGLHTRVFVNSKGIPTYEAKELGLVEAKNRKGTFDISLTVTANETRDYFSVVRAAAEKIFPDLSGKMLTRFHGFMKLTSGKMSSRLGNVVTGESLLADLTEAARSREDVAVGAIKYAVLKQGTGRDIIFDPEKSLSLEGDSGPYIQYALVRARALLRAAKSARVEPEATKPLAEGKSWPSGPERPLSAALSLKRLLVHFPDAVARAAKEMEPHHVVTYITEFAAAFNSWYANERLIVDGKVAADALALVTAAEYTLHRGLLFLGIPSPEEM